MAWMDWDREAKRSREVLERILALLFALAGLADRASGLPAPARLRLLAILGHGEAVARAFVMETAFGAPAEAAAAVSPAAGDAQRLAASFRALALVLGAILAQPRRSAGSLARAVAAQDGSRLPPRKAAGPEAFPALPPPDTS